LRNSLTKYTALHFHQQKLTFFFFPELIEGIVEFSDDILIEQYMQGDTSAFSQLVIRYTPQVFGFVRSIMHDMTEAEDVTQETFVKAWKNIHKFDTSRDFKTWLFSIAHNTAIDYLRKRKSVTFSTLENDELSLSEIIPDDAPLADELAIQSEDKESIRLALGKLKPLYQEVLLLRYTDDFTFEKIGEILKKPLHTVKSQHRRALIALRSLLDAPKERS
jgi:RNA polymerase sigma-70 factor (ECF subfamily)